MKRFFATLVIFAMSICLLSCSQNRTYEDGYADGYSDAESEVQCLMEEEFLDGYDIGYEDGHREGRNDSSESYDTGYEAGYSEVYDAIMDATDYARTQTGWSVYEAWNNISIYNDGVHPYGHALPTESEYLQCIETLVIFCEYLDNAGLGG